MLSDFSEGFGSLYNNIKRNQDVTNMGNMMFEAFTKADLDKVLSYITANRKLVSLNKLFMVYCEEANFSH